MDSGCSHHMTPNLAWFESLSPSDVGHVIVAKDKTSCPVLGQGHVKLQTEQGVVTLTNVLYVPGLGASILSVGKMCKHNASVLFSEHDAKVFVRAKEDPILSAPNENDLFYLRVPVLKHRHVQVPYASEAHPIEAHAVRGASTDEAKGTMELWHARASSRYVYSFRKPWRKEFGWRGSHKNAVNASTAWRGR